VNISIFAAMLRLLFFLFFISNISCCFSQKTIEAFLINERITIDGEFKEESWVSAKPVQDFIQYKPQPGNPSSHQTEVKIIYDNVAIYIAAKCFDEPQNVSTVLSQRDDFNANVDNFQVILDTYNDDQNGFSFGVSSMGVQADSKLYTNTESPELNMVWNSAVIRNENGWQVEIRIPYSAFRFPKAEVQNWGINFFRYISKTREESTWSPIKPDFDNWPAQCGAITNLKGIEPPTRLAFIPYVSAYADHYPSNIEGKSNWSSSYNGGMDIKFGLNEAFTLDMTLVPDFGQVVFDNKVLNLSPFEIQFNENRQFFTEGTELFNKSGLFYSRRIGIQSPYSVLNTNLKENEYLTNVPPSSQLYNATKLSGRTKKGLGIGVFNAITGEQKATAVNEITGAERSVIASPVTNFNVVVLDQNLKNNSSVTLTNTSVMREGNFYDAMVTGLNTKVNSSTNKFFIAGSTALSNKFYSAGSRTGYNYGISVGKQTGSLVYNATYFEESDTYDPNDLGFNANNNKRIIETEMAYRIFKPFWRYNQFATTLGISYNRLYNPDVYTGTYINWSLFTNSKKFHASGIGISASPTNNYDYFEPREPGRYFVGPKWLDINTWISTNYQKRFAFDGSVSYAYVARDGWREAYYRMSPRVRVTNKIFVVYDFSQGFTFNGQGYAVAFGIPVETSDEIVFGSRDQINTINTINLQYTLTNRMGLTFRLRHYRSALSYDSFYYLNDDGTLTPNNLSGLDANGESVYNTNFNAFTIDFVYRWVFLPGSEVNIVWKNAIFSDNKNVQQSYFNNLSTIFNDAPLNSFSIKVLYWLDYQTLKRKK